MVVGKIEIIKVKTLKVGFIFYGYEGIFST